jgi:internalin A
MDEIELLQIIEQAARDQWTDLDLARKDLTILPPQIGQVTSLRELHLSRNKLTSLPAEIGHLTNLRELGLGSNRLTTLPAEIGQLKNLEELYLDWNQLVSLPRELGNLTSLVKLELHVNQLTALPAEIGQLKSLSKLGLGSNQLTTLASEIGQLTSLLELYLDNNQLTALPSGILQLKGLTRLDIAKNGLTELPAEIRELSNLKMLGLARNKLTELPAEIGELANLTDLYLDGNQLTRLPPEVGKLTRLERLYLHDGNEQLSDLTPLQGLTSLASLYLGGTRVSDLEPLVGLTALQMLDVSGTQVRDLSVLVPLINRGCPVLWSSEIWKGNGIYVHDCPLTTPPPEIVNQGNDAILNYLRERALGEVDHLYEAKMLILGEGGAGKTSLLRRLYQPDQPLPTEKESTKGISIYPHEFKLSTGQRFRLNVWDFGGQEIYHATHQFFLTRRSLYLLVDDTRKDHKSVSDEGFKYWLELIDVFGGHSPVLIFQNEKGGRSKAIDIGGITGRYDNVKARYAGNLEHGDAADPLRHGIEFFASSLSHIGEELPARWLKVRADIELRANAEPYISQQEYFHLYSRHMECDRSKALHLSQYLHDLGVFLHFQDDPLLARTVILQNQWATEAVYRILDDETVKAQFGRFNSTDCERLWHDSVYADMHPELLALMQRFELCYELQDSKPPTWLAPQLLPPAKPQELAEWSQPEDLVLRYRYDFLPKGIISRLTVRLHRFVRNPEMAWVTGVLFELDHTAVLVELLANGSEIELRARGPERKALLSVIAADLDALNESFQGLHDKVDKLVPCNCKGCRVASVPEFFTQRNLLRRKENNRLKVECPRSYEDVDVLELLDGIRVDKLPGWANEEQRTTSLAPMRIFLASSAELREDRDAFDLYFRQQNDQLRKKGIYLEIVRWENFLDAMSETRLQDEYNQAIRACDIFVCLFFTKTGKFTEEEFDIAHHQFKDSGRPRIYTFFKNADIKTGNARKEDLNSLWAFQDKLNKLGHFHTYYDNIEHLKRQFRDQLDKMLEE